MKQSSLILLTIGTVALLTSCGQEPMPEPTATPQPTATRIPKPMPTYTPIPEPTATPQPTQTPQPTATRIPRPTPTATPEPIKTSVWTLAYDVENLSQDDWNAEYKGRTVLVGATWSQSWHFMGRGNAVGYSVFVGFVTVRAHLKESESANLSGSWKCRVGEIEGRDRKYKTVHLRECVREL